jgi:hypothetical protein
MRGLSRVSRVLRVSTPCVEHRKKNRTKIAGAAVQCLTQCRICMSPARQAHVHVGLVNGLLALLLGFVCPHPLAAPSSVSSTAALKAAPQFASLALH